MLLDLEAAHTLGGNLGVAELEILDVFVGDLDRLAADDHGNRELVLGAGSRISSPRTTPSSSAPIAMPVASLKSTSVTTSEEVASEEVSEEEASEEDASEEEASEELSSVEDSDEDSSEDEELVGSSRVVMSSARAVTPIDRVVAAAKHHSKHFFHGIGFLLKNSFDPPAQHIRAAWNETEYIREQALFKRFLLPNCNNYRAYCTLNRI